MSEFTKSLNLEAPNQYVSISGFGTSVSEMSTGNSILTCTYSVSVETMTLCYIGFQLS